MLESISGSVLVGYPIVSSRKSPKTVSEGSLEVAFDWQQAVVELCT